MSNSRHLRKLGWGSAAGLVVVLVAGLVGAAVIGRMQSNLPAAAERLDQWGRQALTSKPTTAIQLLSAATLAQPHNYTYATDLAGAYLQTGQPAQALITLTSPNLATAPSPARGWLLRGQAELELNHFTPAGESAAAALRLATDDNMRVDAAIIGLAATGSLPSVPAVSSSEALRRIQTAHASYTALATELAASGLLRSASALLLAHPELSTDHFKLLTQVELKLNNAGTARNAALAGLKLNPADIKLHQLLIDADRRLGNGAEIKQQQELIDQLISGKV